MGLPQKARNVVPAETLRFPDAFARVRSFMTEHPQVPFQIIEDWYPEIQQKISGPFPSAPDRKRSLQTWIFVLDQFKEGQLRAYVCDPGNPKTRRAVPSSGWFIPRGLNFGMSDYLSESWEDVPGPWESTVIAGERQPIFLDRAEFDLWFQRTFAEKNSGKKNPVAASAVQPDRPVRTTDRAHRLVAVKAAIESLYGTAGPPAGLMADSRDKQINAWLEEHGLQPVKRSTIQRALRRRTGD